MRYRVSLEQFKKCLKSSNVHANLKQVLREVLFYIVDGDLHLIHTTMGGHEIYTVYQAEDIEAEAERAGLTPKDVLTNFFNQYVLYAIEIIPDEEWTIRTQETEPRQDWRGI